MMRIRVGYVTNSSSTNFLILSKKELTEEFLYKKLGFKWDSAVHDQAMQMCRDIVNGASYGLQYFDFEEISEGHVMEVFGEKAARIYREKFPQGFFAYMGQTGSDDGVLTCFFTTDSFEIEEKDFYLNARNCVW